MAPKKKQKAAAPAQAAATVPGIEFPFDPHTQELVLDLKGLSGLPADLTTNAVRGFRVLVLPKGKYTHVPKVAGRYLVLGSFSVKHALAKVHFKEALKREPELVTNFLDFGAAKDDPMTGIMVESYQLPLKISHGVYQSQPRFTPEEEIAGFSKINASEISPADLAAFLKRIDQFVKLGITGEDSMLKCIKEPVADRLDNLMDDAVARLDAQLNETERDADEGVRKKATDQHTAQSAELNELVNKIRKLPIESYDATLSARVHCLSALDAPAHEEQQVPAWLTSPLRLQLEEGSAEGGATRLMKPPADRRAFPTPVVRRVAPPETRGSAARGSGGAGPSAAAFAAPTDVESDGPSPIRSKAGLADDSDSVSDEDLPPAAAAAAAVGAKRKRVRKPTDAYAPPAKVAKGKEKAKPTTKPKPKPKPAAAAQAAPLSIRPDTKQPYVRGAYNKNLQTLATAAVATVVPDSSARRRPLTESERSELLRLRVQVATLEARLKVEGEGKASEVKVATLTTKAEMAEKLLEQYQRGLEKGLSMATGFRVSPQPPASAAQM